jgi:hypothetical protein
MATSTLAPAADLTVNITNKPEIIAAVAQIKALKEIERAGKAAEKKRKALEEALITPLFSTGKVFLVVRGVTVAKNTGKGVTHKIDQATLLTAWPEAYAGVHTATPYTYAIYS